jgi:hypothetical protein
LLIDLPWSGVVDKNIFLFSLDNTIYPDRGWKTPYLDLNIHEYKIVYYNKKLELSTLSYHQEQFGDGARLLQKGNLIYVKKEEAESEFRKCGWKSHPISLSLLILFLIYKIFAMKKILR